MLASSTTYSPISSQISYQRCRRTHIQGVRSGEEGCRASSKASLRDYVCRGAGVARAPACTGGGAAAHRRLWIVRGADGIEVACLDHERIMAHRCFVNALAFKRIVFMSIDALEGDGHAVHLREGRRR